MNHPDLFKVNNNTYDEKLLNLCALLADDDSSEGISLPSNFEAEAVVCSIPSKPKNNDQENIMVGKYYVTLMDENGKKLWYVACCEGRNEDGTYKMDHLVRAEKGKDCKWKYPTMPDTFKLT